MFFTEVKAGIPRKRRVARWRAPELWRRSLRPMSQQRLRLLPWVQSPARKATATSAPVPSAPPCQELSASSSRSPFSSPSSWVDSRSPPPLSLSLCVPKLLCFSRPQDCRSCSSPPRSTGRPFLSVPLSLSRAK